MSSFSSGMNPDVVKTALDSVFFQEFNGRLNPGYVDATSEIVFKQDTVDNAAVIQEVFKGTGLWGNKPEEGDVPQATPRVDNQITFNVTEFAQSVDVTRNFFDDNMHGVYEGMVRDMAETGRITRDNNAFGIFRNAFTTTLTADGVALVSDAHVTLSGDTVDNKLTDALSEASLEGALVAMAEQKAQDGTIRGQMANTLLVPPTLYKEAVEIVESEQRSGTADNDINVYSSKYNIFVATSPYLGAVAGGSDTAWFLLGRNHSVTRWVRRGIETTLVNWDTQRNNNYIYKGSFREVLGATDYSGLIGSDGTT